MRAFWFIGLSLVNSISTHSVTAAESSPPPGCRATKEFVPLARLYSELERDAESRELYRQLKRAKRLSCEGAFKLNDTITYSSGARATLYAGRIGASWFWPNGRPVTLYLHKEGAIWTWPNGQTMTLYAYRMDTAWYWPNGRLITNRAGHKGAVYYDPDGRRIVSSGPLLKSAQGQLDLEAFLELVEGLAAEVDAPETT